MAARRLRVWKTVRHPAALPHSSPFRATCPGSPSGRRGPPRGHRTGDVTRAEEPSRDHSQSSQGGLWDPGTRGVPSRQQEGRVRGRGGRSEGREGPEPLRPPARHNPMVTVAKTSARDPQDSPDPGPRLTCLLRWLPPSQRPLGLQLRPRRSWAHPAGDFETSAAPAPPRRWGKPRPRGGNQRKWPWEG